MAYLHIGEWTTWESSVVPSPIAPKSRTLIVESSSSSLNPILPKPIEAMPKIKKIVIENCCTIYVNMWESTIVRETQVVIEVRIKKY